VAGEHPHRNAKLLECLLDGGERRNGAAVSGRSTPAMAAAEGLGCLGFLMREMVAAWGKARAWGALNRVADT
jgi:hypothetical protein